MVILGITGFILLETLILLSFHSALAKLVDPIHVSSMFRILFPWLSRSSIILPNCYRMNRFRKEFALFGIFLTLPKRSWWSFFSTSRTFPSVTWGWCCFTKCYSWDAEWIDLWASRRFSASSLIASRTSEDFLHCSTCFLRCWGSILAFLTRRCTSAASTPNASAAS